MVITSHPEYNLIAVKNSRILPYQPETPLKNGTAACPATADFSSLRLNFYPSRIFFEKNP